MRPAPSPARGTSRPAASPRRLFAATLVATLAFKLLLAAAFPVVGDEAYLFTWAREPAWGYYDHPPLAAWLLHPFFAAGLGGSLPALRLPSVLLHALLALALVRILRRLPGGRREGPNGAEAEERAYLAGTLFLLVPAHVLGVLMLTDVPLIACTFLAGAALFRAELRAERRAEAEPAERAPGSGGLGGYAAAGAFLGLALLAKYLAALLAAAFLVWFLSVETTGRRTRGLALLALCAAPFVLVHLAWNATNCWSTVAFNFYSRHAGEGKNYSVARNLLFYAGAHLYLAGPVLWYLGRRWRRLAEAARSPAWRAVALAFLVPMALLALSAVLLLFGAYWVLPFYPFLFLLAARVLERAELARCVKLSALFTGAQAAILAVAVALPLSAWRETGFYPSLVTMERTEEVLARLAPLRDADTRLAARGYSLASILSWRGGKPVAVWGEGSHYARQDDLWTDWRELAGGDVLLVDKRPIPEEVFDPYFRSVERRELRIEGATLHLARGRGLDYERYRRRVLTRIRDRYYDPPRWLPERGCPFRERYFAEAP